jgi:hypothetical protein
MSRVPPVGVASPSGDIKKRQESDPNRAEVPVCAYGRLTPTTRLASYLFRRGYANAYGVRFSQRLAAGRFPVLSHTNGREPPVRCAAPGLCETRQDKTGAPLQLTCRGAPCGYPGSTVSTESVINDNHGITRTRL